MQNTTFSEPIFDVIGWLNRFEPGARQLRPGEINSVMQFSLVWNLFEAQVCMAKGVKASVPRFRSKAREWENAGHLTSTNWNPFLEYFQRRYIENEATNHLFEGLHLNRKEDRNQVAAVLKGENTDIAGIVTALLTIVYRYRCNLFHGLKWVYGLHDQSVNFNTANQILAKALEIDRRER